MPTSSSWTSRHRSGQSASGASSPIFFGRLQSVDTRAEPLRRQELHGVGRPRTRPVGRPTLAIASPRRRGTERRAHSPDVVRALVLAQPDIRDQVALRLLAQLGLRKNELRLIQYRHLDLAHSTITVFGKGGAVLAVPLVWADLRLDIESLILERQAQPDHFLLFPKNDPGRPMDPASVHDGGLAAPTGLASHGSQCTNSATQRSQSYCERPET